MLFVIAYHYYLVQTIIVYTLFCFVLRFLSQLHLVLVFMFVLFCIYNMLKQKTNSDNIQKLIKTEITTELQIHCYILFVETFVYAISISVLFAYFRFSVNVKFHFKRHVIVQLYKYTVIVKIPQDLYHGTNLYIK